MQIGLLYTEIDENSFELPLLTDLKDDSLVLVVHPQVLAGVLHHGGPQGEGVPEAKLTAGFNYQVISYLAWPGGTLKCCQTRTCTTVHVPV